MQYILHLNFEQFEETISCDYARLIGLPGKGDPGTTQGKSAKIEEECAPVPGSFWSSGLFLAQGLGTFSGVSGWLPLSHCLSDLPRVETLLSDHAQRLGELSNFNVKSCDFSGVPHPGKANDRCIIAPHLDIGNTLFHNFTPKVTS